MSYRRLLILFLFFAASGLAKEPPQRPPVYGIAHVRFRVTNRDASLAFFARGLGFSPKQCQDGKSDCLAVGGPQFIEIEPARGFSGDFLVEVGLLTSDVSAMRKFLLDQGMHPGKIETHGYSSDSVKVNTSTGPQTQVRSSYPSVSVTDPEGNRITFVQQHGETYFLDYDPRVGKHIIHAGFIVRDRAATEHFYKDILGFRPYWHGGMKDKEDDWVTLQVPDGTDWIEMMVNVDANPDQQLRGIMNHIAIGVPDIHETEKLLRAAGAPVNEEPEIGRDGKWQLNVYDPDLTRVEFMEFKPVQKPCCSEFTAAHPGPKP
jgi:catechol 2,3-dioxygenase-like lactoylglutathione lyase family enzyme